MVEIKDGLINSLPTNNAGHLYLAKYWACLVSRQVEWNQLIGKN